MSKQATIERPPAEFFALNGARYLVGPESTAQHLLDSAALLLGSSVAILEADYERMNTAQYGAFYLAQQAHASLQAAISRLAEQTKGAA